MTIPKPSMIADLQALVSDWGAVCKVKRLSGGLDSAGKMSGSFVSVATETYWIQPYDSRRKSGPIRIIEGTADENLHELFGRLSGYVLQTEDKISAPNAPYVYDVLNSTSFENFRHAWLKIPRKS